MASGLRGLLSQAQRLSRKRGQPVTTAHVLLSLYQRTPAAAVLSAHGVSESALIEALASGDEEHPNVVVLAFERADKVALAMEQGRANALHLLLVLAREPRCLASRCLERLGVVSERLQDALTATLQGDAQPSRPRQTAAAAVSAQLPLRVAPHPRPRRVPPSITAQQRLASETESKRARDRARRRPHAPSVAAPAPAALATAPAERVAAERTQPLPQRAPRVPPALPAAAPAACAREAFSLAPERFPLLTSLGRDLCRAAQQGRIDPVLGRELEIEQLLDVLTRRRANNPILVGPPGVGKTAIVEGVALALVRGQARGLEGRVLIELAPAALVSGTGVRGALSERLQALTQEIAQADGRVIVFIDEIHSVVSAEDGADSLAQGIKAALARGELPCIGATTDAEYRRVFERDAALSRRFTRVEIGEPTADAALAILRGLAPEYEKHHGVAYEAAALEAAVELSVRFMPERHLPDKAIALIDQAGARVRRRGGKRASAVSVAEVVAELSAVPLERLLMRDADALLALEAHLADRVIGQSQAICVLADALRKGAAGFRGKRPLGTFLFLGPTGVGKTEMAKAIAELLFPGREPTRIDMSELSEPHALARLIGAPPGYIGHEEGGQLTEAVRARPYQLVLLDEIEKAHRDVLLALLPLLDEGRLTDGRGRTVDFRNTVIVMTSNLGASALEARARVGFGAADPAASAELVQQRLIDSARAALPPELWNRIDEPLCFRPLDRAAVVCIAERMLARVVEVVAREHGIALSIDPSAIDALIAAGGYDPALGARPMRRTVGRLLEARFARAVLAGELERGDGVLARGRADHIEFERTRAVATDAAE